MPSIYLSSTATVPLFSNKSEILFADPLNLWSTMCLSMARLRLD
jgi:hypothetical protein